MESGIPIGMDMGDRNHSVCVLDAEGEVLQRCTVTNTGKGIRKYFGKQEPCRLALEAGKVRIIWDSDEKDDDRDAEMLARIARFDPHLLYPIHHRGQEAHSDLAVIKARDMRVKTRAILVLHARGAVKAMGERISKCSAEAFHIRLLEEMPLERQPALEAVMKSIEDLTVRIRHYDKLIDKLCREKYPETEGLRAVSGVGPVTALAFVLTIEESDRFHKSRAIGPFLGLVPERDKSGQTNKQLGIPNLNYSPARRV